MVLEELADVGVLRLGTGHCDFGEALFNLRHDLCRNNVHNLVDWDLASVGPDGFKISHDNPK